MAVDSSIQYPLKRYNFDEYLDIVKRFSYNYGPVYNDDIRNINIEVASIDQFYSFIDRIQYTELEQWFVFHSGKHIEVRLRMKGRDTTNRLARSTSISLNIITCDTIEAQEIEEILEVWDKFPNMFWALRLSAQARKRLGV